MAITNFRVAGFVLGLGIKAPVHTAAIINIPSPTGVGGNINGYIVSEYDRVLLTAQTNPIDNGIYSVRRTAWIRDGDADGNRDFVGGTLVPVWNQAQADILLYRLGGDPDAKTIGVDALTFTVYYDPAGAGVEVDTLQLVTVRGNTTDQGIVISAGGLQTDGDVYIGNQAAAGADIPGYGQIWVNITPNPDELYFTDSDGNDINLVTELWDNGTRQVLAHPFGAAFRTAIFVGDDDNGFGIGAGTIYVADKPSSGVDFTDQGQWWNRDDTPNVPMFTNYDGDDQVIDPSLSEVNVQNGNYTTVITDKGKTISKESGGAGETYTIDSNANVPHKIGTFISFNNDGGDDLSIAITTDTLIFADDNTTGTRTLADGGYAVAQKIAATVWKIAGKQLT